MTVSLIIYTKIKLTYEHIIYSGTNLIKISKYLIKIGKKIVSSIEKLKKKWTIYCILIISGYKHLIRRSRMNRIPRW